MNILILKNTVVDGRIVQAGQTVDASVADGRLLVRMGKAMEVVEVVEVPTPDVLDTVEAAAVVKQTHRGRRAK